MSELLSKISSYNLYNYLLVGFVYNMLLCHYTQLGYVDESIFKDSHCVLCDGIIYCQISISFFGTTSYSASLE